MTMEPENRANRPELDYAVRYRDIRYPRLELRTGSLLLVLPKGYRDETGLLEKHRNWVNKRKTQIQFALNESKNRKLADRPEQEFRELIEPMVGKYEAMGIVNGVIYRRMKSKWASYSLRRNLTLNTLLKYLPNRLIEYVVFHELTHSKEKRHNAKFWATIEANVRARQFP